MNNYLKRTEEILREIGCTYKIEYAGYAYNRLWNDNEKRNLYNVTIKTDKGTMTFDFWDSLYNTRITRMSLSEYAFKYHNLTECDTLKIIEQYEEAKKEAKPSIYDVIAGLTKYSPETFDDFCWTYGYDKDNIKALEIYQAAWDEWENMCDVFTLEQIEKLQEIQKIYKYSQE